MKLLSAFQSKDRQQEEITSRLLRSQEVEDLAMKANANLARAEADFASTIARNRSKWALEEEEHANRIKDMSKEIQSLEKRKEQALIPIYLYKKEADNLVSEAQEIVKKAKEKEEQAEYLQDKLEEKLTEVADRENILDTEEKRIEIAKQSILAQKETTKDGIARLSKEMILFHEKQQAEEEILIQRKNEVSMAEINFNAKLEKYARDLEALKTWDTQLRDERGILDREYARSKK